MSKEILSIFKTLETKNTSNNSSGDTYLVEKIPNYKTHRIGISDEGTPVFFIKHPKNSVVNNNNIDLALIRVLFNQRIKSIDEENKYEEDIFTVVFLKTNDNDFIVYFIDVMSIVIEKIGDLPDSQLLENEIKKLVELFYRFSEPPRKTIQGLWAELFIIEQSRNPEYLIQSWHSGIEDTYDFNDGIDKFEVKSVSNNKRVHSFSMLQLSPNEGSELFVASVFVVNSGNGKTIIDIKKSIESKISSLDTKFKLNEIISKTIGADFNKVSDIYFDYQSAIDSYKLFYYKNIPCIEKQYIPSELCNVRFECDITNIDVLSKKSEHFANSKLFTAI